MWIPAPWSPTWRACRIAATSASAVRYALQRSLAAARPVPPRSPVRALSSNSDSSSAWTVTGMSLCAACSTASTNISTLTPISPVESARNTSPSANNSRSNRLSGSQSGVTPPLIPQSTTESAVSVTFRSNASPETVGGAVFGWSTTVVTPPAAADREPLCQVSLCGSPGTRK